jgi:hypothetical protein
MEIKRIGSQPSVKGPSEWFTGAVRIDPLFPATAPALVQGASVTFEPGARTAWHTHPLGQTLIVTAGCGKGEAVLKGAAGIDEGSGDVIAATLGRRFGPVIVDVHGRAHRGYAAGRGVNSTRTSPQFGGL